MALEFANFWTDNVKKNDVVKGADESVEYGENKCTDCMKVTLMLVNQVADVVVAFHNRDMCKYTFGWYWSFATFYTVLHGVFFDLLRFARKKKGCMSAMKTMDWQFPKPNKQWYSWLFAWTQFPMTKLIFFFSFFNPWGFVVFPLSFWLMNTILQCRSNDVAEEDQMEWANKEKEKLNKHKEWQYQQEKMGRDMTGQQKRINTFEYARDPDDVLSAICALTGDIPNLMTLAVIALYKHTSIDLFNSINTVLTVAAIAVRLGYGMGTITPKQKKEMDENLKQAGEWVAGGEAGGE